jgi:probable F420-dependent oxidoreductase
MKHIKFGVLPVLSKQSFPVEEWAQTVKNIEELGYSGVFKQDHFDTTAYDPIALLASAASVTKTLNIGSFVFSVDFRHPVILAKAAATLHLISSGRFEFGIGAGYQPYDYNMAGIPLDPASTRVERLEEALKIITGMWTQDKTSFTGKHYQVSEIEKAGELAEGKHPKVMIGAGGRRMLRLAAKYADIVNIIPRWPGSWSKDIEDQTIDGIIRKINIVKKAAEDFGRDPTCIEFQLYIQWNEMTDSSERIRERVDGISKEFGTRSEVVAKSEFVLIGSSSYIKDRIKRLIDETGVSYFVLDIRRDQFKEYAQNIIKPLTK